MRPVERGRDRHRWPGRQHLHDHRGPQNFSLSGNEFWLNIYFRESNSTFSYKARDADEREKWVRRLEDTILRYANRSRALWEQQYSGGSAGSTSYGTPGSSTRRTNNLALFDKKVTEADAYLQLMIEQTTVIEDGFLVGCPVLISFVYYLQKIDNRIQALEEGEEALCLKGIHDHANVSFLIRCCEFCKIFFKMFMKIFTGNARQH